MPSGELHAVEEYLRVELPTAGCRLRNADLDADADADAAESVYDGPTFVGPGASTPSPIASAR